MLLKFDNSQIFIYKHFLTEVGSSIIPSTTHPPADYQNLRHCSTTTSDHAAGPESRRARKTDGRARATGHVNDCRESGSRRLLLTCETACTANVPDDAVRPHHSAGLVGWRGRTATDDDGGIIVRSSVGVSVENAATDGEWPRSRVDAKDSPEKQQEKTRRPSEIKKPRFSDASDSRRRNKTSSGQRSGVAYRVRRATADLRPPPSHPTPPPTPIALLRARARTGSPVRPRAPDFLAGAKKNTLLSFIFFFL